MKKLLVTIIVAMAIVTLATAQVWKFDSDFAHLKNPHGVVVTPDGKIWTANYSKKDTLITGTDTLITNPIYIYNPDGTLEETLRILSGPAGTDTLVNTCRGISLDNDGNVLYTHYGEIWHINYQTHELMHIFNPHNYSMTEAAATEDGYYYCGHVGPGKPLYILDSDFQLFGYVTDTLKGLQRSIVCSKDGNNIFVGKIYSGDNGVQHFQSIDGAGAESEAFVPVDTFGTVYEYVTEDSVLVHKMWGQCLDWDHQGLLWVGTYWDVDSLAFTAWYALDSTQNWAVVDTIGHLYIKPGQGWVGAPEGVGAYYAPRGIAFSADGKTAYTADFDGGFIKKWTNPNPKGPGSSIIPLSDLVITTIDENGQRSIVVDFQLKQNYPNPFNPTTAIPFDLKTAKHVVLKVYDMNGRLIQTLINKKLTPGHYEFKFDGSNLASGTYIYQLLVDNQMVNKKMVLVK